MVKKVVIVGAGNAGLSAAHQLHKAGIDFEVLEAAGRIGGRVQIEQSGDILYCAGPTVTEPQWETTFEYINELDMTDRVFKVPSSTYGLYLNGEMKYFVDDGNLFKALLQIKGLPAKLVAQGAKFLPGFIKAMNMVGDQHDFSKLAEVSDMNTKEWATKLGGAEIPDKLLGPMLGTMVLARSQDVSAAHPIALMKLMEGMCVVFGGLKTINEGLYEPIKDKVRLNTPIAEIIINDGVVGGVKLEDGEVIETDKVICATNTIDALRLMPNLPQAMRDALKTCDYSQTWHYVFYVPKVIFEGPGGAGATFIPESEDSVICSLGISPLTAMDQVPGSEAKHDFTGAAQLITAYTGFWHDDKLNAMSEEERAQFVADEITKYYPAFAGEYELIACDRINNAINLESPGQFRAIEDLKENHLSDVKGLYLGGEYLFLIASTEGAWATGKEAALKLIAEQ